VQRILQAYRAQAGSFGTARDALREQLAQPGDAELCQTLTGPARAPDDTTEPADAEAAQ
jgi:hypothetical protein